MTASFGVFADLLGTLFASVVLLIFMLLASIYISLGAHTYHDAFLHLVPAAYQAEIGTLWTRIATMWKAFFRGQVLLMLIIGVFVWLGLAALGVPGALVLGIIAGLLELVPYVGPIIAAIPAVIVALVQGSTYLAISPLALVALVIAFYVIVQELENSVIVPRVLGDAVGLPALVVITGVLIGGTVGGILGALLATPVIGSVREILQYVHSKLLGHDPYPPSAAVPPDAGPPRGRLLGLLRALARRFVPVGASASAERAPMAAPDPNTGAETTEVTRSGSNTA